MALPNLLRKAFLLSLFLVSAGNLTTLSGQSLAKRYLNNILNDTSNLEKSQFISYPTVAFSPETSWEIGISSLFLFFAKEDTSNRLSEIKAFSFFTLENQYGIWLDHAIYTDKDRWFFLGNLRWQSFPLLYNGIGPNTPAEHIALVEANQFTFRQRFLRKIGKDFFFGIESDFQRMSSVRFVPSEGQNGGFTLPRGANGSSNWGLGLGLVYDTRQNVLNVRDGYFSELAFLHYDPTWGSNFRFSTIIWDSRIYRPISKNNVLAAQVFGQFNWGQTPFNQLALLGGENLMRGYYMGRYRDQNQIASQFEYRILPLPLGFTDRLGLAFFAGVGSVFENAQQFSSSNLVWSGGGGLRFLLFKGKDIYTRLDAAFTPEGTGFYFFIGEAF